MTWCWFQRVCQEFLPPWHHECCVAGGNSQPQNYGTLTSTKTFQTQRKTKSLLALDAIVSNICQKTCKYYYQSEIHACHCMSMGCWIVFSLTQFQRDLTWHVQKQVAAFFYGHDTGREGMSVTSPHGKDGPWRGFLQKPSQIGKGLLRHATYPKIPMVWSTLYWPNRWLESSQFGWWVFRITWSVEAKGSHQKMTWCYMFDVFMLDLPPP